MSETQKTNERDELSAVITSAEAARYKLYEHDVEDIAETILAAGYRKPRVVTNAAELDALPEGSVILCNDGDDSAQAAGGGYWYLWGGDIALESAEIATPATVLHEGDAS